MPSSTVQKINPDLAKERRTATFDVEEFAAWWYGGVKKLQEKREIIEAILEEPEIKDEYPCSYRSYQDSYDNAIKKIYCLARRLRQIQKERNPGGTDIFPKLMSGVMSYWICVQGSPIDLHMVAFIPAIKSHGTAEQAAKWVPRAENFELLGTYAQTELGHGTFLRGLETRADYDRRTEEFVLSSPTLTSYKWWPGGLGHTANYAVVMAQLYIDDKSCGVQLFVVQLRDEETHMPLPGIIIGDIGDKMGIRTVNNGYLAFKNFRIPRMNMLMKHAQVMPDGSFKQSPMAVLAYFTMVEVRAWIVCNAAVMTAVAAVIATRYSAVRRQSLINPNEPECQIIDHVTQQLKLFPEIAKSVVMKISYDYLAELLREANQDVLQQKYDRLPETHALVCALKAVSTMDAKDAVENLRLACGGHGYMNSSSLPAISSLTAAAPTFEGENTVLLLQTARFLMKSWANALKGEELVPTVAYLADAVKSHRWSKWDSSTKGLVRTLQLVAANKIRVAFNHLEARKEKMTVPEAANLTGIELAKAAKLHGRAFMVSAALQHIESTLNRNSSSLNSVLKDLLELYLVNNCLRNMGEILRFTVITEADQTALQFRLEAALAKIRPNAVAIVDGFDIHDFHLRSALGSYDGNVYERIFACAQQSPMNKIPVQKSFEEYLKPFMRSSL